jgi:hypothetical protein
VSISQVVYSSEIEKVKKLSANQREDEIYLGPDFVSLPEEVQKSLSDFLVESGLNQQTVAFIEVMSLDKEQRLYMKWLQDTQNFVKGKNMI